MAFDRVMKVKERGPQDSLRRWRIQCPYILVDIENAKCMFVYKWTNSQALPDVSAPYNLATLVDMGYYIIEDLGDNNTYIEKVTEHMNSIRRER